MITSRTSLALLLLTVIASSPLHARTPSQAARTVALLEQILKEQQRARRPKSSLAAVTASTAVVSTCLLFAWDRIERLIPSHLRLQNIPASHQNKKSVETETINEEAASDTFASDTFAQKEESTNL